MFFFLMVIELAPKTGGKIFILYKTHCRCLLESWHGSVDHTCKPQRLCAVLSCRVAHKTSPLFTESYCIIFYLHNNNAQGPQTGPGSCLPLGVTHLQRQPLSKDFAIEIAEKTNSGRKTGVIGWLRPEGEDQRSWGWGSGRRGWFGIIFGQGSWWKWTGGKLKGSLVFSYFYDILGNGSSKIIHIRKLGKLQSCSNNHVGKPCWDMRRMNFWMWATVLHPNKIVLSPTPALA